MALTPQQQLKMRHLTAKRELRETTKAISEFLRFPVLISDVHYEANVSQRPSELEKVPSVQLIRILFGVPRSLVLDLYTNQLLPPRANVPHSSFTFADPGKISTTVRHMSLVERRTYFAGLVRLLDKPKFQLLFSQNQNPVDPDSGGVFNYRDANLWIDLDYAEILLAIQDGDRKFRKHLDLVKLVADLDCLQEPK